MSDLIKFERKNCAPCILVGNALRDANIPHKAVDVEVDPKLAIHFDIISVPAIVHEGQTIVGGANCMAYITQLNAKGRD